MLDCEKNGLRVIATYLILNFSICVSIFCLFFFFTIFIFLLPRSTLKVDLNGQLIQSLSIFVYKILSLPVEYFDSRTQKNGFKQLQDIK